MILHREFGLIAGKEPALLNLHCLRLYLVLEKGGLFCGANPVRAAPWGRRMTRGWFAAVLLVSVGWFLPAPLWSQTNQYGQEVMRAEEARVSALVQGDLLALDRILGDDLRYVHASGMLDTKASFLGAIRSGKLHYIHWQAKDLHVRVLGDSAVLEGAHSVQVSDTRMQPDPFNVNILVLAIYARRDGRWQQIAWQSTRDTGTQRGAR